MTNRPRSWALQAPLLKAERHLDKREYEMAISVFQSVCESPDVNDTLKARARKRKITAQKRLIESKMSRNDIEGALQECRVSEPELAHFTLEAMWKLGRFQEGRELITEKQGFPNCNEGKFYRSSYMLRVIQMKLAVLEEYLAESDYLRAYEICRILEEYNYHGPEYYLYHYECLYELKNPRVADEFGKMHDLKIKNMETNIENINILVALAKYYAHCSFSFKKLESLVNAIMKLKEKTPQERAERLMQNMQLKLYFMRHLQELREKVDKEKTVDGKQHYLQEMEAFCAAKGETDMAFRHCLEQGTLYYQALLYDKTVEICQKIEAIYKPSIEVMRLRRDAYVKKGDIARARLHANEAYKVTKDSRDLAVLEQIKGMTPRQEPQPRPPRPPPQVKPKSPAARVDHQVEKKLDDLVKNIFSLGLKELPPRFEDVKKHTNAVVRDCHPDKIGKAGHELFIEKNKIIEKVVRFRNEYQTLFQYYSAHKDRLASMWRNKYL